MCKLRNLRTFLLSSFIDYLSLLFLSSYYVLFIVFLTIINKNLRNFQKPEITLKQHMETECVGLKGSILCLLSSHSLFKHLRVSAISKVILKFDEGVKKREIIRGRNDE